MGHLLHPNSVLREDPPTFSAGENLLVSSSPSDNAIYNKKFTRVSLPLVPGAELLTPT